MKKSLARILGARGLLDQFLHNDNFSLRIENGSFHPLIVERHGPVVIIAHITLQNGDVISDPEMTFKIEQSTSDWHLWPTSLQIATGHREDAEVLRGGKVLINPRAQREQIQFSTAWARTLIAQGFHRPNKGSPEAAT